MSRQRHCSRCETLAFTTEKSGYGIANYITPSGAFELRDSNVTSAHASSTTVSRWQDHHMLQTLKSSSFFHQLY